MDMVQAIKFGLLYVISIRTHAHSVVQPDISLPKWTMGQNLKPFVQNAMAGKR